MAADAISLNARWIYLARLRKVSLLSVQKVGHIQTLTYYEDDKQESTSSVGKTMAFKDGVMFVLLFVTNRE